MASIQQRLRGRGYDDRTVELASQPQRPSTLELYNKQWEAFVSYCNSFGWTAHHATSTQLAQYLTHLFDRGLAPATIQVHRAAISSVISTDTYNPSEDEVVRNLIRRFHRDRPRTVRIVPDWDLSFVLAQLLKPPFVQGTPPSDRRIPLQYLLFKTTFLLALASGARRSELHALVRTPPSFLITKEGTSGSKKMQLRAYAGFVAKNQVPDTVFQPFVIPSMAHLVPDEPERLLCPVRATELYVQRTSHPAFLQRRRRLLLHYDPSISDTRLSHISQWIVNTVVLAYRHADDDTARLMQVKAHEVRAIANSVAYFNNVSLSEVMQGARWRSRGTFVGHYLRDAQQELSGLYRLAPVVVAQRIIQPPDRTFE